MKAGIVSGYASGDQVGGQSGRLTLVLSFATTMQLVGYG